ncbi:MAG: fibronectin type III domain-containing protein [Thermoplasmata archaeon]
MNRKVFVIFAVILLGFLLVPLSIPRSVVASSATLLEPTEIQSTSLVLRWDHPYEEPDPDGDGICYRKRLEVHVSTTLNFTPNSSTYYRSAYSYTRMEIYGLDPSTTYYFKIVVLHRSWYGEEASCSLGSQPSNEVSATTLPSPVYIQSIVANLDRPWDSVDISWNANRDQVGFEAYVIERAFTANFSDAVTVGNISNQATERHTVTGLAPSTAYFFRVDVHAITGVANPSSPEAVMTEEIPKAIALTLNTPSGPDTTRESVRLSWGPVHDKYCDMYVIERARLPDFADSVSVTVKDCNITEYDWRGLEASTEYYFRVVSHNAAGIEATSNTVTATTRSQSVPMTEIMIAANTVILVMVLLLVLISLMRKRSKTSKQE